MAYGFELVLALPDPVLIELAASAGPASDADVREPENQPEPVTARQARYDLIQDAWAAVEDDLARVHEQLIRAAFDPNAYRSGIRGQAGDPLGDHYLSAHTPEGLRTFRAFAIEGFGDETDTTAIAGISLWSRYVPVWCDWRHQYGGSGFPVVLDTELLERVQTARDALATVIPAIADVPLVTVLQHY